MWFWVQFCYDVFVQIWILQIVELCQEMICIFCIIDVQVGVYVIIQSVFIVVQVIYIVKVGIDCEQDVVSLGLDVEINSKCVCNVQIIICGCIVC